MDQTTDETAGQEAQHCKSEIQYQKTLKSQENFYF